MGLRLILAMIWLLPLAASAGLLYYEFMVPAASGDEPGYADADVSAACRLGTQRTRQ